MFKIQNAMKSYDSGHHPILDDVSHEWVRGGIHSILGKSGAGKTTLLRCLAGLETLDAGEIFFDEVPLSSLSKRERREVSRKTGYMFQGYTLLKRRTVIENIFFPQRSVERYVSKKHIKNAHVLLERVGLSSKEKSYPVELSGGQRQRVAIARALYLNPKVLLCDEFTSALDITTTNEILDLLKELQRDFNLTIIMVSHDLGVIKKFATHVLVLDKGHIVENSTLSPLFSNPQSAVSQELVEQHYHITLPDFLKAKVHDTCQEDDEAVWLLHFGSSSTQPVIARLIETFHVKLNIISGNLECLEEKTFGRLMISFPYDRKQSDLVAEFLVNSGVQIQRLGYLRW